MFMSILIFQEKSGPFFILFYIFWLNVLFLIVYNEIVVIVLCIYIYLSFFPQSIK